jgi:hypothetical protein
MKHRKLLMWGRLATNVDWLLSFDIVIKLVINNPLIGS